MFKRLLAFLFPRKPAEMLNRPQSKYDAAAHAHRINDAMKAEIAKRPAPPIHRNSFTSGPGRRSDAETGRTIYISTPSSRDDSRDIMNPLNPVSPIHSHNHADWDSSSHRHHDSSSYDSGGSDSGSSSGGSCD